MRAMLLVMVGWGVLAVLSGGAARGGAVGDTAADAWQPAAAEIGATEVITWSAYLPFVARVAADGCQPIPGAEFGILDVPPPPTDRPAEVHADLNLALRGYEVTDAFLGLVQYSGGFDPLAPQLRGLFADGRTPAFTTVYKVYDWDWECGEDGCRGPLLTRWDVTLAGMGVAAGETIHVPDSGKTIGQGYEVLVLYASEERITLKYTLDDNVVSGYTVHVENVCVEPSLLALYQEWNAAGRGRLPALEAGQAFGRAQSGEIGVAIRDAGTFMDPRSEKDWWQGR